MAGLELRKIKSWNGTTGSGGENRNIIDDNFQIINEFSQETLGKLEKVAVATRPDGSTVVYTDATTGKIPDSLLSVDISDNGYLKLGTTISDSTIQSTVSVVVPSDNRIFLLTAKSDGWLRVMDVKNNFTQLAAIGLPNQEGRIAACLDGNLIHILVTDQIPHDVNLLRYYVFNTSLNTLVSSVPINTGENLSTCWSMCMFKGSVYACVSYQATFSSPGTGGSFDSNKAIISLYKLASGTFAKVSEIANPVDIWGKSITVDGVTRWSLGLTGYWRGTLSTDGTTLYCSYIGTSLNSQAAHLVFTKKSTDQYRWYNDEILANARCNYSNLFHYRGEKIYLCKAYISNAFSFAATDLVFTLNNKFKKGFYSLLPFIQENGPSTNEISNIYEDTDRVYVVISYRISARTAISVLVFSKDDIARKLKGSVATDRGLFMELPSKPSVGDAYTVTKEGKTTIPSWTYPYSGSVRKEYIEIGKNEIVKASYNGSAYAYTSTPLTYANSRKDVIVFEHLAQFNAFNSRNFRIPVITDSADGTILFATVDIRYTSMADEEPIEVGFARSLDGGRTWVDFQIIFKRDENANMLNRVHDCSMCVNRNKSSATYGRLWAFSKKINTDLPEPQWSTSNVTFLARYSDDNGLTWSAESNLTSLFPADATQRSPAVSAGITLTNGTLLLPVYFSKVENGTTKQYASFIYSTNGTTWLFGDITPGAGGENSIIQRPDGILFMNARDAFVNYTTRRAYTLTAIGAGWVNAPEYEVFQTVNVQESLVNNRGVYLYSQPTGYENSTGRTRITIFKSKDLIHWEKLIQITPIWSGGYSNLIFRDNLLGILYEGENPDLDIKYTILDYLLPIVYS